MGNQKMRFDVVGMPTTKYRKDPDKAVVAECRELSGARNFAHEWFLLEKHGRLDCENKEAHFDVPTLRVPHKNEAAILAAIAARIKTLEDDGWIYKYTTTFDPKMGRCVPLRIP